MATKGSKFLGLVNKEVWLFGLRRDTIISELYAVAIIYTANIYCQLTAAIQKLTALIAK